MRWFPVSALRAVYFGILRVDPWIVVILLALGGTSLLILNSASGGSQYMIVRQTTHILVALLCFVICSNCSLRQLRHLAVPLYVLTLVLLAAVLYAGVAGKGAVRWLDFGIVRFQPSELMKLALPLLLALLLARRPLPRPLPAFMVGLLCIIVPVLLVARQPDLGTAILICGSGLIVFVLAGLRWRVLFGAGGLSVLIAAPLLWTHMHAYQRDRLLYFLNPERDPLGSGYHIIQSKIAIGSGGLYGKGWGNSTQSGLDFLPERTTDFVFAVYCEEFGFIGFLLLFSLYLFLFGRCLIIGLRTEDLYGSVLCGAYAATLLAHVLVNMGMNSGLLPVVGVPLPLISVGGSSMISFALMLGIVSAVSIQSRPRAVLPRMV